MYASHKSYGDNAGLGAAEADLLVDLVKGREAAGLYGAKITGGGSGGTVAVLLDDTDRAAAAVGEVVAAYREANRTRPRFCSTPPPPARPTSAASFSKSGRNAAQVRP